MSLRFHLAFCLIAMMGATVSPTNVMAFGPGGDRVPLAPVPESTPGIELPSHNGSAQSFASQIVKSKDSYVRLDSGSGSVETLIGDLTPAAAGDAATIARSFLGSRLGLPLSADTTLAQSESKTDQLSFGRIQRSSGTQHVVFAHIVDGVPVRGEEVTVHVGDDGKVHALTGAYHTTPATPFTATITAEQAIAQAVSQIGAKSFRQNPTTKRVWVPMNGQLQAAYQVDIAAEAPLGDFEIIVAADSGKVVGGEDRLVYLQGEGKVWNHSPLDEKPASVTLNYLNESGNLSGQYADVRNAATERAKSATRKFNYEPSNTHFNEVTVYNNINKIHDFYKKTLGYTDRDKPIKATVHYGDKYDNAFFSPATDSMTFGDGGKRLNDLAAEDNVLFHEYSHAVVHTIVSLRGGEAGAMNEGFSDYFAGTVNNKPTVGVWVAKKMGKPWLRNMTNTKHYPEDVKNEVHADGEIWGGVCWDLRKALGAKVADMVLHKSRYYLRAGATFVNGLEGVLAADKALNSSQNAAKIRQVFTARGIKGSSVSRMDESVQALDRQSTFQLLFADK